MLRARRGPGLLSVPTERSWETPVETTASSRCQGVGKAQTSRRLARSGSGSDVFTQQSEKPEAEQGINQANCICEV